MRRSLDRSRFRFESGCWAQTATTFRARYAPSSSWRTSRPSPSRTSTERPVPSIARGFSAPIKLEMERSREDLAFLMAHDSDPFNRWEAGQTFAKDVLLELVRRERRRPALEIGPCTGTRISQNLVRPEPRRVDQGADAFASFRGVAVPGAEPRRPGCRPQCARIRRSRARRCPSRRLDEHIRAAPAAAPTPSTRRRSIVGASRTARCATWWRSRARHDCPGRRAVPHGHGMTDYEAAFSTLVDLDSSETDRAIAEFYDRWCGEPLVLDKWFRMQAMSSSPASVRPGGRALQSP